MKTVEIEKYLDNDYVKNVIEKLSLKKVIRDGHAYLIGETIILDVYAFEHEWELYIDVIKSDSKEFLSLDNIKEDDPRLGEMQQFYKTFKLDFSPALEDGSLDINLQFKFCYNLALILKFYVNSNYTINDNRFNWKQLSTSQAERVFSSQPIVNSEKFFRISVSNDPEIMGNPPTQINNFVDSEKYTREDYEKYQGIHSTIDLNLHIFNMHSSSKQTDFISSRFLFHNGFFGNKKLKSTFEDVNPNDLKILNAKAYKKGVEIDLFYFLVNDAININFKESEFTITNQDNQVSQIVMHNEEEFQKGMKDRLLKRINNKTEVSKLAIKKLPKIFKVPLIPGFFISADLKAKLIENDIVGYDCEPSKIVFVDSDKD